MGDFLINPCCQKQSYIFQPFDLKIKNYAQTLVASCASRKGTTLKFSFFPNCFVEFVLQLYRLILIVKCKKKSSRQVPCLVGIYETQKNGILIPMEPDSF